MPKINWVRVSVGGAVAAIIAFFSDGLLHERLLGTYWKAVYDNLGIAPPEHNSIGIVYLQSSSWAAACSRCSSTL